MGRGGVGRGGVGWGRVGGGGGGGGGGTRSFGRLIACLRGVFIFLGMW